MIMNNCHTFAAFIQNPKINGEHPWKAISSGEWGDDCTEGRKLAIAATLIARDTENPEVIRIAVRGVMQEVNVSACGIEVGFMTTLAELAVRGL